MGKYYETNVKLSKGNSGTGADGVEAVKQRQSGLRVGLGI